MIRSSFKVTDTATPYLAKALREIERKQPINLAVAEGASAVVQGHFAELAVTNRNRFGVRGGFWQRMLLGTKALATDAYGYILMPRAVALRYFGGTVRPTRTEFLALPARAEAYNRSPRDFNDLRFVRTRRGGMLIQREQTAFSRDGSGDASNRTKLGGIVMYFLVRSVTIRRDESVLPTMVQLSEAGALAGEGFIRRRLGLA